MAETGLQSYLQIRRGSISTTSWMCNGHGIINLSTASRWVASCSGYFPKGKRPLGTHCVGS